jgi:hyperosmotically inducible periplasmic protein
MRHFVGSGLIVVMATGYAVRAQSQSQSEEAPVAIVMAVEDGTCDECPYHHPEKSSRLLLNAALKADDEVRCKGRAYVIATYLETNTFFFLEGERWNPVGNPGTNSNEEHDSETPRKGLLSYNDIMDAERAARVAVAADLQAQSRLAATSHADKRLTLAVRQALVSSDIDVSDVKVRSKGGAVLLKGKVPEHEQVMKAEGVAQGVPGVKDVQNKLSVFGDFQK